MRYRMLTTGLEYDKQSKIPAVIFCFSFLLLLAQIQRGGTGRKGLKKSRQFLERNSPSRESCVHTLLCCINRYSQA